MKLFRGITIITLLSLSGVVNAIRWTDKAQGFCESYAPYDLEYVNIISSVALVLAGAFLLFTESKSDGQFQQIGAIVFVTGIGSIGYHYTLYEGWGAIDELPMLFLVYRGTFLSLDLILDPLRKSSNTNILFVSERLAQLFFTALFIVAAVMSIIDDTQEYFAVIFPVGAIILALMHLYMALVTYRDVDTAEMMYAWKIITIGYIVVIISSALWTVTEPFCEDYPDLFYLQAHAFWHVGAAIGVIYIAQVMRFIYITNRGYECRFVKFNEVSKWYEKLYLALAPKLLLIGKEDGEGTSAESYNLLTEGDE